MKNKIIKSINKFTLNLQNKVVLTEAATGNYVVTSVIAAKSGAKVYAFAKDSEYGSIKEVVKQTKQLAKSLDCLKNIEIVTDFGDVPFSQIDIVTNTGFLRPIDKYMIEKLPKDCVIPLMWEPWEFRDQDIDLNACMKKGIKVYGTNEDDYRLRTKEYIGYIVLALLLKLKYTPINSKVLVLGCAEFTNYVVDILNKVEFNFDLVEDYSKKIAIDKYDVLVLLEHCNDILLIGNTKDSFININEIEKDKTVIHIAGNVDFTDAGFYYVPQNPAKFGYMSYTTDYMGAHVVIDLHTAGLKVAEGMLRANKLKLKGTKYKEYLESNYPALAFNDVKYW